MSNSLIAYDAIAVDVSAADDELTDRGNCDAIWVGGAGDVVLTTLGDRNETFTLPSSSILPVGATKIVKVGTTATQIKALYLKA